MDNAIMVIFGTVEVAVMVTGIFCIPFTKNKGRLLMGILLLIIQCGVEMLESDNIYILTIEVFLGMIQILIWIEGGLLRKIAVYFCSVAYTGLPYFCINLIYMWISDETMVSMEEKIVYQIIRAIITILLIVVLSIILKRTKYREIIRNLPTGYFVIGSICGMAGSFVRSFMGDVIEVYGETTFTNIVEGAFVVVIITFYMVGIGIAVINRLKSRYQVENNLKDEYLRTTREYVRTVRHNARETRKLRHDMRNHITVLDYYLKGKEYQKAEEYLLQLKEHMEQSFRRTVSVNHEIVDAIITEMQQRSEGDGIRWEVEGAMPANIKISDFALCTIFSNILNNSVEACRKLPQEERYIHLEIRNLDDKLVIELVNPVKEPVEIEKLGITTSKPDKENHGFGIENVKNMVERNYGEITFKNLEGSFGVIILFAIRV